MKLITLNTWGGPIFDPLLAFIKRNVDTDVICLQEVFHTESDKTIIEKGARADMYKEISALLPDHIGYFASAQDGVQPGGIEVDFHLEFGLATFVRKSIEVKDYDVKFVHRYKNGMATNQLGSMGRNIQCIKLLHEGEEWSVINFHGLWNGQGKSDTEDRLLQSQKLRESYDLMKGKRVVCGDFNLLPDTESIKIIGEGLRDLVGEYGVTSTRSSYYEKSIKLADYIFTSPEVEVEHFEVMQDEVSDHLPLLLIAK